MVLKYLDFDLKIELIQGREYAVSVIDSPTGQAVGTFTLPFDPSDLGIILETVDDALRRSLRDAHRAAPRKSQTGP